MVEEPIVHLSFSAKLSMKIHIFTPNQEVSNMIIIVGNEISNPRSNPGQSSVHLTSS